MTAQNRVYVATWYRSSISVLRDTGGIVGLEGSFEPQAASRRPMPTIIRGVLVLGAVDGRQKAADRAILLDAAGRKVLDLKPGANDVRHLAPGVYFCRQTAGFAPCAPASSVMRDASSITKVVVTR